MFSHVTRLVIGQIGRVPDWHPDHDAFKAFPIHVWLVRHPTATILVDTGAGLHNELIDDWYAPNTIPVGELLAREGLGTGDIDIVVLTHLHFDHCGQASAFQAPVYVQAAELEASEAPGYTVPEWAAIPTARLRIVEGDTELADGVRLLFTPGHTPGHQSVVVEDKLGTIVLGGQCAFHGEEIRSGDPADSNLHGDAWREPARASLARIAALEPRTVELSHDDPVSR
jgi:N-acyl homoserine lactone hydrolase